MSKKQSHIHKYGRLRVSDSYSVIGCFIPLCNHFLSEQMFLAKCEAGIQSICWDCGRTFTMRDKEAAKRTKKFACPECKEKRIPANLRAKLELQGKREEIEIFSKEIEEPLCETEDGETLDSDQRDMLEKILRG